jgi:hypothetical protein
MTDIDGDLNMNTYFSNMGNLPIENRNEPKYESYQCQKCGKLIGWLGRFIEWITFGLIKHKCKTN